MASGGSRYHKPFLFTSTRRRATPFRGRARSIPRTPKRALDVDDVDAVEIGRQGAKDL